MAKPHRPDNRASVREVAGTRLDRAYVGSCTGGKLEDFEAAARVLKGREVVIPTHIVPATTLVGEQLHTTFVGDQSLHDIFEAAGCLMGHASCGACLGGPADTVGRAQAERDDPLDDQPQLPRPHGRPERSRLPRLPAHRRRERPVGPHHRPARRGVRELGSS